MTSSVSSLVRKVSSKPLNVVAFRAIQELHLWWMQRCGGWRRVAGRASTMPAPTMNLTVLLLSAPKLNPTQNKVLKKWCDQILASDYAVFGHKVPQLENCDFSVDWRYGFRWNERYFKEYSFYEHKEIPYDVKFPWELSRLAFLIPVLAQQVVGCSDVATTIWVKKLLDRWDKENPIAHSVNWYPMEASMRAINLVLMLDLVRSALSKGDDELLKSVQQELVTVIARLLFKNASFVWFTREYTDVRGNHFTANIVALYLAGLALRGIACESKRWHRYSKNRLEQEIRLQFLKDGVNFEKACGYHKLVLELFALAAIAAGKNHEPLAPDCLELLEKATVFSDAITRPDGLAANFGDTDDATALSFAPVPLRSHGAIVEVMRAWRSKPFGGVRYSEVEAIAAIFLVGKNESALPTKELPEICCFEDGGYYIVRNQAQGFYFIADVGEVGMAGRGGHGHNDILAFELFVDGNPVVQDPGCSGYTADLQKKAWYRSTAAHATVQLFDSEMADMTSPWTISDHARPCKVRVNTDGFSLNLTASHKGFSRIKSGSFVKREFRVDPVLQSLQIRDEITVLSEGGYASWHFPSGSVGKFDFSEENHEVRVGSARLRAELAPHFEQAPFSQGYGQEKLGGVLKFLTSLNAGVNRFQFIFSKASAGVEA